MRLLLVLALALPWASPSASAQALPSLDWRQLQQADFVRQSGRFVRYFPEPVRQLNGRTVRVEGYMMPLENGRQHREFLFTPFPLADCFFCFPGGPSSVILVKADRPVTFSYDPIRLRGRLVLAGNDLDGPFYELTAARAD